MGESDALAILKEAILLEQRGKSFYQKVSEQTDNAAVRSFFASMADEEQSHMDILSEQFKAYKEKGEFAAGTFDQGATGQATADVLSDDITEKISCAGFEAAAIGAAISMEERAVNVYSKRAGATSDSEEKALYEWLAAWERGHLNTLVELDKALVEKIWNDNQFWPF